MITEQNILDAIKDARAGGYAGRKYNQRSWCGSECCVLGFARRRAGADQFRGGPRPGEIEDTPRARIFAEILHLESPGILDFMEAIQPDGSLTAGVTIEIDGDILMHHLTAIPENVTLKATGNISLPNLSAIATGVTLSAGERIWLDSLIHLNSGSVLPPNAYAPLLKKEAE